MEIVSMLLILAGLLVSLVGGVMCLVAAFKEGIGWGLAYLFVPFAALVFVIMHWSETKKGFLLSLGGGALMVLGAVLGGAAAGGPEGL